MSRKPKKTLTQEQIAQAKRLRAQNRRLWTQKKLADFFGVSVPYLSRVLKQAERKEEQAGRS